MVAGTASDSVDMWDISRVLMLAGKRADGTVSEKVGMLDWLRDG